MLFVKTPTEILDYDQDYSDLLITGETVTASDWAFTPAVTDPLLVIDSSEFTTTSSKVWLSGGELCTEYRVENTIVTSDDRTYTRGFNLQVSAIRE